MDGLPRHPAPLVLWRPWSSDDRDEEEQRALRSIEAINARVSVGTRRSGSLGPGRDIARVRERAAHDHEPIETGDAGHLGVRSQVGRGADVRGLELAEHAAMTLAGTVGVPAPRKAVVRAHDEDLAEAVGLSSGEKYGVTAEQVVERLHEADSTGALARAFVQQLAFNTLVGNADAHAKYCSVLLRPDGVSFAPIYDVVPTALYPSFEQALAMRIAGARYPQAVKRDHWRKFVRRVALYPDDVVSFVSDVATGMAAMNDCAWAGLDEDHAHVMRATVGRNTELALPEPHR